LFLIFLEATVGCQQWSGAKVQGLVLASLRTKKLEQEETAEKIF